MSRWRRLSGSERAPCYTQNSYRSFVYNAQQLSASDAPVPPLSPPNLPPVHPPAWPPPRLPGARVGPGPGTGRYKFRNATRLIDRFLPAAAEPIGFFYPKSVACTLGPDNFTRWWYHAAPSGIGRLWHHLYVDGSHAALGSLYRAVPLPSFRVDFPQERRDGCAMIKLLRSLPEPAALLQLGSLTPSYLFHDCAASMLPNAGLPWVDDAHEPPLYWKGRHRGEWFPV